MLARPVGRGRTTWLDNYLTRIVERDATDLSHLQRLGELPLLLRVIAARNSEELNLADIARDTGIPVRTLAPYVELLETLYLIQRIPAWSTNLTARVVSRPKVALLDTGLAARLVHISAPGAAPTATGALAGHLLEGFVAGELRRQLGWADATAQLSHYRDHGGGEIDLILETPDGTVAGIEVKSSATVAARDARWLAQLRDRVGSRFAAGIVLHTGTTSGPLGEKIAAVPLDIL